MRARARTQTDEMSIVIKAIVALIVALFGL